MIPKDPTSKDNRKNPKLIGNIPKDSRSAKIHSIRHKKRGEAGDLQASLFVKAMDGLIDQIEIEEAKGDQRKIRANHRSVTGWLANARGQEPIAFESTLERDCAYLASFDERVFSVRSQPHTIVYRKANGRMTRYTPDYEIKYDRAGKAQSVLVEVKELATLKDQLSVLRPKFKAAATYCEKQGGRFVVLTENQLRPPLIKNVKFLYGIRVQRQVKTIARLHLLKRIKPILPATVDEILGLDGKNKLDRAMIQTLLWGLIAENSVYIDLTRPILLSSRIELRDDSQVKPLFFEEGEPW